MSFWGAVSRWVKGAEAAESEREVKRVNERVSAIPLDAARARVELLLQDPEKYHVTIAAAAAARPALIDELPPAAHQLFERYEFIQEKYGDTQLGREILARSDNDPRLLRIGYDLGYSELAVAPDAETVYWLTDGEGREMAAATHPSVYHFILSSAAGLYGEHLLDGL